MGAFLAKLVCNKTGETLTEIVLPNLLANEGLDVLLHQLFPPYVSPATYILGVTGAFLRSKEVRPNGTLTELPLDQFVTFEDLTDALANEGGCYTDEMRDSFGYLRRSVSFSAEAEGDGGLFSSGYVEFPNDHEWEPQDENDWDDTDTRPTIEQAPPEWANRYNWEPVVGFPWQVPRKLCSRINDHQGSYWDQWEPLGSLDWLCDFRRVGGFPLSVVFLADSSRDELLAMACFRAPVLLRPGLSLHVRYQARIVRNITRQFAFRFARYAFEKSGSRYSSIWARPLLSSSPAFTRRTTYEDIESHFEIEFDETELSSWTFVEDSDGPAWIQTSSEPTWVNSSSNILGPFGGIAIYGKVAGLNELMWITPIDPPVEVPAGDNLVVDGGIRFSFEVQ